MLKLPPKNPNNIEVVVAAYQENLSWTEKIDHPTLIYHKGNQSSKNAIRLPNIGRESHTYFHHIVDRYDSLSDITIFCQGNPFDHCPHFLQVANLNSIELMNQYNVAYKRPLDTQFCPLSKVIWVTTAKENIENKWDYLYRLPQAIITLEHFFPRHQATQNFMACWGAMFAVTKERIHKFPKQTYQKVLTLHQDYWSMPWAMEYIWMHLFHKNYHPIKSITV